MDGEAQVKPYLPSELAKLYGISVNTFRGVWLKPFQQEIGKRNGYYYTIKQVEIIFSKLGKP